MNPIHWLLNGALKAQIGEQNVTQLLQQSYVEVASWGSTWEVA